MQIPSSIGWLPVSIRHRSTLVSLGAAGWRSIAAISAATLVTACASRKQAGDAAALDFQPTLAITNVAVVDVRESDARRAVRPNQTVLVSGDRITRVGPGLATADARVVDGTGKYLIPGLWDMHVHTLSRSRADLFFPLFIAHGITGVRDMGSTGRDAQAAFEEFGFFHQWRDEIAGGTRVGPRIAAAAGVLVDGAPPVFPFALSVANAGQARAAVRDLKERGASFIKVYGLLSREAYFAIADESRTLGLPFAGHVPNAVSAAEAADAGQKSIEHLNNVLLAASSREDELRRERLAAVSEPSRVMVRQNAAIVESYSDKKGRALLERFRRNGTWHAPTLTVIRSFAFVGDSGYRASFADRLKYLTPDTQLRWRPEQNPVLRAYLADSAIMAGARSIYRRSVRFVGELHRAGVPILAATDTPNPWVFPGSGLHEELALLVDGGLTPLDALRSATLHPARFLGTEATMGSVEAGKVADLVLLDANPLEDIAHTRRIRTVVANGRLFDRAALDSLLARVEGLAKR